MASPDTPSLDTDDAESTAPESTLSLKRSPTASSYYDFDQVPWDGNQGQSWMYASHARDQQWGLLLPRLQSAVHGATKTSNACEYPSYFGNSEKLPLSTKSEFIVNPTANKSTKGWLHHPLIPGRIATFSGSKRESGAVRSFYAPSNPLIFDVGYHQKNGEFKNGKLKIAKFRIAKFKNGKLKQRRFHNEKSKNEKSKNGRFKMATYHPAVKEADKIGVVAENSNEY